MREKKITRKTSICSEVFASDLARLLKKLEPCHQEELFQKNLRVQDGDVGCPANQGVGGVGQRMDDIVAHQVTVFVLKHGEQKVLDHLGIHWT